MAVVKKEFTYFDDGCFPTVHAVGETVSGEVEAFAIAECFAVIADPASKSKTKPAPKRKK